MSAITAARSFITKIVAIGMNGRTSVDGCTVIYCDGTNEAWDTIDEAFDCRGYAHPAEDIRADGHTFIYDHDYDDWFCLEKKLDYFTKLNTEVNKIIEGK